MEAVLNTIPESKPTSLQLRKRILRLAFQRLWAFALPRFRPRLRLTLVSRMS